jgi:GcrA cell cycle regulator
MSWTDERVELLKKLWAQGATCSHIAARLGGNLSRNAVIGKVHRLGLAGRVVPVRSHSERIGGSPKIRKVRVKPAPAVSQKSILAELPVEPLQKEDTRPDVLVALHDLEPHHCRWVYGDPKQGDHGFCGSEKVIGLPYCTAHARRAFRPVQVGERTVKVNGNEKVIA